MGVDSASPCAKHPMQIEDAKKLYGMMTVIRDDQACQDNAQRPARDDDMP